MGKQIIYTQDCESFRYEDRLYWSRFQTLTIIEGAAIGVLLTNYIKGIPAIIIAFGTFFLVSLVLILALKDRNDSKNFIDRISDYEAKNRVKPIVPSHKVTLFEITRKKVTLFKLAIKFDSLIFTKCVLCLITAFNIYLIYYAFKYSLHLASN